MLLVFPDPSSSADLLTSKSTRTHFCAVSKKQWVSVRWFIQQSAEPRRQILWRDGYGCLSCSEGWGWRVEKRFGSPLQGWRSPTPSWDFHFLVEFDLPLSLVGRSKNPTFSDSTSLGGCVHETSSHRTCLVGGIVALQQFP